eukprot:scaffold120883_cov20-Tisochrysis_lutea.AAC.1
MITANGKQAIIPDSKEPLVEVGCPTWFSFSATLSTFSVVQSGLAVLLMLQNKQTLSKADPFKSQQLWWRKVLEAAGVEITPAVVEEGPGGRRHWGQAEPVMDVFSRYGAPGLHRVLPGTTTSIKRPFAMSILAP